MNHERENIKMVKYVFNLIKQNRILIVLKQSLKREYLQIIFFPYLSFFLRPFAGPIFFKIILFVGLFFIDFDGCYRVRTDEGQPRPKYIFNKLWN